MRVELTPKTPIIFVINSVEYPIVRPTLGAALDVEEKVESAKTEGKGGTKVIVDYLVACGLPLSVVRALDVEDLELVMNALTPAKKKG